MKIDELPKIRSVQPYGLVPDTEWDCTKTYYCLTEAQAQEYCELKNRFALIDNEETDFLLNDMRKMSSEEQYDHTIKMASIWIRIKEQNQKFRAALQAIATSRYDTSETWTREIATKALEEK